MSVTLCVGFCLLWLKADATPAGFSEAVIQSECRDRYLWLHVASTGPPPQFEAVDGGGIHSLSEPLASRCGYTISTLRMGGYTTVRASYYSCYTQNQNDKVFTFSINVLLSDATGHWSSRHVSTSCSPAEPWSPRELVCEEDYMEVSVSRDVSCDAQQGGGGGGQAWNVAASLAQQAATSTWQLMFLQDGGQAVAMSVTEAQSLGYSVMVTSRRVVLRSPYRQPHSQELTVHGVPVEVVQASLFLRQKLAVVMIDVSLACTLNSGSFDGARLLWDVPRVMTPLVGGEGRFESRSLGLGVEGRLLDRPTAAARGFSLDLHGDLVQITVPFGAEGGYRRSLVVDNVYSEMYVISLLYEHVFSLLHDDGSGVETRHRLFRVLDTPLRCQRPITIDQTVSDDHQFSVYLGNIPADVALEEVKVNGKQLWTAEAAEERSHSVGHVVHTNGSHAYTLRVPFEDAVVHRMNLGEGVLQFSLDINFTLTIVPHGDSYHHHTFITARLHDAFPPELQAECTEGGVTFSVEKTPRLGSLWEVGVGQEPLTAELAAQRGYRLRNESQSITLEVPVSSVGYTYEDIDLLHFYGTFKLLLRDSQTLEVQVSTSKRCLFKTKEMIVCSADGFMTVVTTPTATWPTVHPDKTSLLDRSCGPKQTDGSSVLFEFSLDSCGTRAMVGESYVVYENEIVQDRHLIADGPAFISRDSQFRLTVRCFYPLNAVSRLFVDRIFRSETPGFGSIKVLENTKDAAIELPAPECPLHLPAKQVSSLASVHQSPAPAAGAQPRPAPGNSHFVTVPGGNHKLFHGSHGSVIQHFPTISAHPVPPEGGEASGPADTNPAFRDPDHPGDLWGLSSLHQTNVLNLDMNWDQFPVSQHGIVKPNSDQQRPSVVNLSQGKHGLSPGPQDKPIGSHDQSSVSSAGPGDSTADERTNLQLQNPDQTVSHLYHRFQMGNMPTSPLDPIPHQPHHYDLYQINKRHEGVVRVSARDKKFVPVGAQQTASKDVKTVTDSPGDTQRSRASQKHLEGAAQSLNVNPSQHKPPSNVLGKQTSQVSDPMTAGPSEQRNIQPVESGRPHSIRVKPQSVFALSGDHLNQQSVVQHDSSRSHNIQQASVSEFSHDGKLVTVSTETSDKYISQLTVHSVNSSTDLTPIPFQHESRKHKGQQSVGALSTDQNRRPSAQLTTAGEKRPTSQHTPNHSGSSSRDENEFKESLFQQLVQTAMKQDRGAHSVRVRPDPSASNLNIQHPSWHVQSSGQNILQQVAASHIRVKPTSSQQQASPGSSGEHRVPHRLGIQGSQEAFGHFDPVTREGNSNTATNRYEMPWSSKVESNSELQNVMKGTRVPYLGAFKPAPREPEKSQSQTLKLLENPATSLFQLNNMHHTNYHTASQSHAGQQRPQAFLNQAESQSQSRAMQPVTVKSDSSPGKLDEPTSQGGQDATVTGSEFPLSHREPATVHLPLSPSRRKPHVNQQTSQTVRVRPGSHILQEPVQPSAGGKPDPGLVSQQITRHLHHDTSVQPITHRLVSPDIYHQLPKHGRPQDHAATSGNQSHILDNYSAEISELTPYKKCSKNGSLYNIVKVSSSLARRVGSPGGGARTGSGHSHLDSPSPGKDFQSSVRPSNISRVTSRECHPNQHVKEPHWNPAHLSPEHAQTDSFNSASSSHANEAGYPGEHDLTDPRMGVDPPGASVGIQSSNQRNSDCPASGGVSTVSGGGPGHYGASVHQGIVRGKQNS
ncbi:uncharacterized protein LOC115356423 isoform X2 [Myripristis murdjan]|uniref:uncharacterized protein LOC115356423 isoform X2 n=1 Tax=Myripristis murdjan TaxID=586833 RepID=UPI0011762226|nr:uncharacterized protein LOC115356423 isoform X2 [Myripristis murdjan]